MNRKHRRQTRVWLLMMALGAYAVAYTILLSAPAKASYFCPSHDVEHCAAAHHIPQPVAPPGTPWWGPPQPPPVHDVEIKGGVGGRVG